jgi:hypothetical protein
MVDRNLRQDRRACHARRIIRCAWIAGDAPESRIPDRPNDGIFHRPVKKAGNVKVPDCRKVIADNHR